MRQVAGQQGALSVAELPEACVAMIHSPWRLGWQELTTVTPILQTLCV